MKTPIVSALILSALLAGAAAPVVYAQATAPSAEQAQAPGATQTPQRPQRTRHLPGERIEARIAYLRTALKITPAQETQWNALANVLRQQARQRDVDIQQRRAQRDSQTAQTQPPTAIQRLEQRQQMMTKAAAQTNDILTAAKPLYAVLSDDQKKVADDLFGHDGGRHHHWHH